MCKKHPKYKAIKVPRADCEDCWKLYVEKHGKDEAIIAYFTLFKKNEKVNH